MEFDDFRYNLSNNLRKSFLSLHFWIFVIEKVRLFLFSRTQRL